MSLKEKAHIMDEAAMERALVRIAHQIVEKNHGTDHLCLVGIKTRGVPLAQRLGRNISRLEGVDIPVPGRLEHHRRSAGGQRHPRALLCGRDDRGAGG